MQTGETVFIPDATTDPSLKHVKGELLNRRVKSITVVPITWRGVAIGAIFLRTFRDGPTFSDEDVRFVQVVAALTAQALRNAHRYERLAQRQQETGETMRRMELERVALLSFLRRLLGVFGEREGAWAEGLLPRASGGELDRVGAAPAEKFRKHRHLVPMLSLANAFNEAELAEWEDRNARLLPEVRSAGYTLEVKIDGAAVSLTYDDGVLVTGATRGNGVEGEDVTANLRTVGDIPLRLKGKAWPKRVGVRGEGYLPKTRFAPLNKEPERASGP